MATAKVIQNIFRKTSRIQSTSETNDNRNQSQHSKSDEKSSSEASTNDSFDARHPYENDDELYLDGCHSSQSAHGIDIQETHGNTASMNISRFSAVRQVFRQVEPVNRGSNCSIKCY